jgi:FkbM family methyltransferase
VGRPVPDVSGRISTIKDRLASPAPWAERVRGFVTELRGAAEFAPASRPRYCADALLYRLLRVFPSTMSDRRRTVTLRDGTKLTYRRNRGDIQSIREVWLTPTYQPPFEARGFDVVVDLGANIGFATLYFARRYGARTCVAVEPDPDNARLLRHNLEQNGIRAIVHEAAVGPEDGTASFSRAHESNLGHVTCDGGGVPVPILSMPTLLAHIDGARVDMLKIDIEGGEAELFGRDTEWLDRVETIMMELHSAVVATEPVVLCIESHGFRHVPVNSVRWGTTDAFVR